MEPSGPDRWQPLANGTEEGSNRRKPLPWVATGSPQPDLTIRMAPFRG